MSEVAKEEKGSCGLTSHGELMVGLASWTTCSVGMLVFNKLAIKAFPVSCTLVAFQFLFTAFVMLLPPSVQTIHLGSMKDVLRWAMVVPFFTGMILSSILALKYAPMTLVMTFRALSPVLSLTVERFYPNPLTVSPLMIFSLFGCLVGMYLYLYDMDKSNLSGMWWAVLNNFFAVGDRLLQRLMLGKDQNPVDISKTGCTLLNNSLGMIPLLIAAACTNEFPDIAPALQELDAWGIVWVTVSCFVGVGISYTGIWVQTMISATSFLVLVNANKFFILFIEVFLMKEKSLGNMQMVGAAVSILMAVLYGKAREAVESAPKEKSEEAEALTESSGTGSGSDE